MEWWRISILIFCVMLCVRGDDQPPTANGGTMRSKALNECITWGNVEISIKNKNGTFTNVKHIPDDLLCVFPSLFRSDQGIQHLFLDKEDQNIPLSSVGLYGLNSNLSPKFARLLIFRTKENHDDESESYVKHGCYGTIDPSMMPDEPWLAFIKRGQCKFSRKLENAVNVHGAEGFVLYNHDSRVRKVIMNLTDTSHTTIMIGNSIGSNIEKLDLLLTLLEHNFPNHKLPYTSQLYTNISFANYEETWKRKGSPMNAAQVVAYKNSTNTFASETTARIITPVNAAQPLTTNSDAQTTSIKGDAQTTIQGNGGQNITLKNNTNNIITNINAQTVTAEASTQIVTAEISTQSVTAETSTQTVTAEIGSKTVTGEISSHTANADIITQTVAPQKDNQANAPANGAQTITPKNSVQNVTPQISAPTITLNNAAPTFITVSLGLSVVLTIAMTIAMKTA